MTQHAASDPVILLHGLARTRSSMWPLAHALRRSGFEPHLIAYPSRRAPLPALADHVERSLRALPELAGRPVHFVGFSLGGVLARAVTTRDLPFQVGRLVQIGTPNRGSRAARQFDWPGVRHFFGPVLSDLVPDSAALTGLAPPRADTGVIIGQLGLHPLLPHTWLTAAVNRHDPRPSDGVVEMEYADLPTAVDRCIVTGSHSFLPWQPAVIRATVNFMKHGRFDMNP